MSSEGYEFQCSKCGKPIGFENAYENIHKPLCKECNEKKLFKSKTTIKEERDKEKEGMGLLYEEI